MAIAQFTQALQITGRRQLHATFSLDWLNQNRHDALAVLLLHLLQRREIAERHFEEIPGKSLKPRRTAGPSLADKVPSVRPWNALVMTTTSGCSMPLRQPYKRASFSAVSLASAPELLKNARSIPDSSVSRLASCCCQSMLYRFDVCRSNPPAR